MRYSLADYIVTIKPNDPEIATVFQSLSIGGQGTALGSINLNTNANLWETTGYPTGAWIHNKSYDRHGTCVININQMSPEVALLVQLCNHYYTGDYGGVTITVSAANGGESRTVATCIDCYVQKNADKTFGAAAENQNWVFTCGQVVYD